MSYVEHNTQAACVRWFNLTHPSLALNLFNVPNGARRTWWQAAQAKAEGLVPGVADLILMVPSADGTYHGLCIEMKKRAEEWEDGKLVVKRGYQSPEQEAWEKAVTAQGYRYEIVHTTQEFMNLINHYLNDRKSTI